MIVSCSQKGAGAVVALCTRGERRGLVMAEERECAYRYIVKVKEAQYLYTVKYAEHMRSSFCVCAAVAPFDGEDTTETPWGSRGKRLSVELFE